MDETFVFNVKKLEMYEELFGGKTLEELGKLGFEEIIMACEHETIKQYNLWLLLPDYMKKFIKDHVSPGASVRVNMNVCIISDNDSLF